MAEDIQIGDVVWLNSGGPPMTVTLIEGGILQACWFHRGDTRVDRLPVACVTLTALAPGDTMGRRL